MKHTKEIDMSFTYHAAAGATIRPPVRIITVVATFAFTASAGAQHGGAR